MNKVAENFLVLVYIFKSIFFMFYINEFVFSNTVSA